MALIAPAFVTLNPSYIEPGLIMNYMQPSGAFDLLPEGGPRTRLGEDDLAVVFKRLELRTRMAAGQVSTGQLPSPGLFASYFQAPTYLLQVSAEYNHHDVAAASRWGFGLDQALRLGVYQAFAQVMRIAMLYGMNPANGEGFANANGATAVSLPADSNGNQRASTYDNGQMSFFLAQLMGAIKTRTNNLGIGRKFVMIGPQQDLELFEYNVVQVTQFQRTGAGTESTKGVINHILMQNGDELIWGYDDTLIGKGAGGTDLIIIAMPELAVPKGKGAYNTNKFAELQPGITACLDMLTDMVAPREITSPLPRGATDKLWEMRTTSGIPIRPEGLTLLSMAN